MFLSLIAIMAKVRLGLVEAQTFKLGGYLTASCVSSITHFRVFLGLNLCAAT